MSWIICGIISVAVSIFGTVKMFRRNEPLYFKMIVCASWCYTAQILYQLCLLYAVGSDGAYGDNILSGLGTNAYAAFAFAANYGQFDSIIDGKNKKYRKLRLISLAAPALFIVFAAVLFVLWPVSGEPILELVLYMAVSASLMPGCVYFNLKYLLLRDDGVLVRGVRPLNLCSLLFCFAFLAELFASALGYIVLRDIFLYVLVSIVAATVLAAEWGRRQWHN